MIKLYVNKGAIVTKLCIIWNFFSIRFKYKFYEKLQNFKALSLSRVKRMKTLGSV